MSASPDLATLEMEYFEPFLQQKFAAQPWDGPNHHSSFELELVRSVSHLTARQPGRRTPFSLFFSGPAGVTLEQGTYAVTHPQAGEMPIFLVPVARKDDRIQLQAVFN